MAYSKKSQVGKKTKKTRTKKRKLPTIPQLEKRLWPLFSLAVRLKGAEKETFIYEGNKITTGRCTCVTCGTKMLYYGGGGSCHAGHFRSRRHKATKYEFLNVHPQCATCNTFGEGEQYAYGKYLNKTYGPDVAEQLFINSKVSFKMTREYIAEKTEECLRIIAYHAHTKDLWEWSGAGVINKTTLAKIKEYALQYSKGKVFEG